MLTVCLFNHLVKKMFLCNKKKRMVGAEAVLQRGGYLQEHLFVQPINI